MTDATSSTGRKQLHVFAIVEHKESNRPAHWVRVGTAFPNRDGSMSLYLDAFPIGTNKLHVREPRPWDEDRNGSHRHDGTPTEVRP